MRKKKKLVCLDECNFGGGDKRNGCCQNPTCLFSSVLPLRFSSPLIYSAHHCGA